MSIPRLYIQQLYFDGVSYTKGEVVDLLEAFNIGCSKFPFMKNPESKELPTRDWPGEDGRDVYIPKKIPIKEYDIEVDFIYKGSEDNISRDITAFVNFLYGRNNKAVGGRLAIYDDYLKMGRKDVRVLSVSNDVYSCSNDDPDAIATFKVKFSVEDPVTDVYPKFGEAADGSVTINDLFFKTT